MTTSLDFSAALRALKDGERVTRKGWPTGHEIVLQTNNENPSISVKSKMTEQYIYVEWPTYGGAYPQRSRVPWVAAQADLLAVDWEIVE